LIISFIIRQTEKFTIRLHKLVALIFAVNFEIIIQWAVGNESCYAMKNTLIITVLSNRSRKTHRYGLVQTYINSDTENFLLNDK
jgi:hypothetical protein